MALSDTVSAPVYRYVCGRVLGMDRTAEGWAVPAHADPDPAELHRLEGMLAMLPTLVYLALWLVVVMTVTVHVESPLLGAASSVAPGLVTLVSTDQLTRFRLADNGRQDL